MCIYMSTHTYLLTLIHFIHQEKSEKKWLVQHTTIVSEEQPRSHFPFFCPSPELNVTQQILETTTEFHGWLAFWPLVKKVERLNSYSSNATTLQRLLSHLQPAGKSDCLRSAPPWFLELCFSSTHWSCNRRWRRCQQGKCYSPGCGGRSVPLSAPLQQA